MCSHKHHVKLSLEDRSRMVRLAEEIQGRTEEMARILVRNLDQARAPRSVKQFILSQRGAALHLDFRSQAVATNGEVIDVDLDEITIGCYQDPPGVCCAGPCPCEAPSATNP